MQTKVEICGVNTAGLPVLSAAETDALLRRAADGDRQARDELIRGNLRRSVHTAATRTSSWRPMRRAASKTRS